MKNKIALGLIIFMLASIVSPGGAFAAWAQPSSNIQVNAVDVPAGAKLVLNITMKVVNDEDSGNVGYWALDNYEKHVMVWQKTDGTFLAVVGYTGKWNTFAGALSPGSGVPESKDASGTMNGGYTATFSATGVTPTFGNVGTFDFGGSRADVLKGTYGAGQAGPVTPSSWLSTYFTGAAGFDYSVWGWTYRYRDQRWDNFSTGTSGDIIV